MGLVDYSSSSSDSESDDLPPAKKPRQSSSSSSGPAPLPRPRSGPNSESPDKSQSLPPLPPQFYDLYASTVRTTTIDSPSLHQNRTRQIPHIPGQWPSFLYIEYIPPPQTFNLLSSLLTKLPPSIIPITSFLTNDLKVPQPLHISLSRTLSLPTSSKDSFLKRIQTAVSTSDIHPFSLHITGVKWHRSSESDRSFLVLRVKSDDDSNSELSLLLQRFNQICKEYSQPELYTDEGVDAEDVETAFHVSIGWSFSQVTDEITRETEKVFGEEKVRENIEREIEIEVESLKARIGNVVTNIELPNGKKKGNLFGMGL
ncbi:hypothetical protein QBC38DRAFT_84153 [Podospora fimiseda]|uniref:U6 snRNA phosphodiesterase n=1 Tax=Podospora fimiseda TaxID=252190 RepID=A0AAN7BUB8_9PEZI|nr:hypothetical protein QBC38DRAFT_84153 [Podospora fimiseda]